MDYITSNYDLLEPLGIQTNRKFGKVFLAQDKTSKKFVVIKTIQKTDKNKMIIERLQTESTFRLFQNNLPTVIDFQESNEEVALIRPYIQGITLDQYWKCIRRKNQFETWKKIIHQLKDIFESLRENKIAHCDIKPSNLLVDESDGVLKITLIDFGMAFNFSQPEKRSTLFPLGYAAPELVLNHLDVVDHTTDLYALGIVSWQLFTGKIPLTHPNPSIFTNLQITHQLPDNQNLPKYLFPILSKMCFKHSFALPPNKINQEDVKTALKTAIQQRYQTICEIIEDIDSIPKKKNWFW